MRAFEDLKLAPIANLIFDLSTGPHTKAGKPRQAGTVKTSESQIAKVDSGTQVRAIDVLWAWLQSRGRAEEAARMAGMHRHTLTKYLGVIGTTALHGGNQRIGTFSKPSTSVSKA